MIIFDRKKKLLQLNRAAKNFSESDFIFRESAERLINNFGLYIVKDFENCLDLGDRAGILAEEIAKNPKIKDFAETSFSKKLFSTSDNKKLLIDEELIDVLPDSYDLVISNLALHWVNDLPGSLIQIKNILRKGGFFTANIFGGRTLQELRESFISADQENNIYSPRISPFADAKDMAGLLQRAGFSEPVAFSEEINVKYENLNDLLHDLRNMGETNCLIQSNKNYAGRNYFKNCEEFYRDKFSDGHNLLNTTFEIITFSGWKS